jgi:hypothetical protein
MTGVVAALCVGVVLGSVSRLCMAGMTLAAGESPSFSISGTTFVLLLYVVCMLPGGVAAALTGSRVRWIPFAAGAAVLAAGGIGVGSAELSDLGALGTAAAVSATALALGIAVTVVAAPILTDALATRWTSGVSAARGAESPVQLPAQRPARAGTRRAVSRGRR